MTATIRLAREKRTMERFRKWYVALDGEIVGSIRNDETKDLPAEPGTRLLTVGRGHKLSLTRVITIDDGEILLYVCRPRVSLLTCLAYWATSRCRYDLFGVVGADRPIG